MPRAALPTSAKGWLVALLASMVGFVAGFATVAVMARWLT